MTSEASPDAVLDALAEAHHAVFCEGLETEGFRFGPVTDVYLKTHEQLKSFTNLAASEKVAYRDQARRLVDTLSAAGYHLAPGDASTTPLDIDTLAAADHARWLEAKIAAGWRYSPRTDNTQRLHSAIVPWQPLSASERTRLAPYVAMALGPGELPEKKKDICRDLFRNAHRILAAAGLVARKADVEKPRVPAEGVPGLPRVFISAKSSDYGYAQQVYEFLAAAGIPAFFSRESLPELGSADYRKQIDRVLDEAEHLVVVTSSTENVRAPWVEAEWGFFISEKRSGRKPGNLVTIVVGGLAPASLPPSLRYYEVIPLESLDRLLGYVKTPQ